ncbi:MAG: TlpA disulfide reductase family protein [Pseudomonadota bacterium]
MRNLTRTIPYRPLTALLAALFLVACSEAPTPTATPTLKTGPWQARVELPGGAATFGMEVARDANGLVVTLINGTERIRVPQVTLSDDRISIQFPAFNNRIDARLQADGRLSGTLTLVKRYGKTQVIPFAAAPGSQQSAQAPIAAAGDLSGRWEVTFTEEDGSTYPAVGEFSQRGNRLLGTFLTETGDYRFLGGSVNGQQMKLSTFDGAHAFLFSANMLDDGRLQGQFWSGNASLESWTARRNDNAKLADMSTLTFLKPGYERFEFTFPDLDGNPVSLDDERFAGKVVLVTLAGSWCPNCHDEAAFMADFYKRYRDQGVEVVALMYEHLEDEAAAREQVRLFREKFGIEYTTLLAGISDKTMAGETLPMLNQVLAYPTTLFIDRRGEVREIHTGFSGPGTGEYYEALKKKITTLVDTLVAEPAVDIEPAEEVAAAGATASAAAG